VGLTLPLPAGGNALNAVRTVVGAILTILLIRRRAYIVKKQGIRISVFFADFLMVRMILARIECLPFIKMITDRWVHTAKTLETVRY
jgi:hypothetical protein